MLISQLEICQEGGVEKGGNWRTLKVSAWKHGGHGHVIPDIMNDVFYPKEDTLKILC